MLAEKQIAKSMASYAIPLPAFYRVSRSICFSAKRPRAWFLVRHHCPRNQLLMVDRIFTAEVASESMGGVQGESEEGDEPYSRSVESSDNSRPV
jgi:hypothetical protein